MTPSGPLTALLALVAGCAGAREAVAPTTPATALRETGLKGAADAMVHGARLVPLHFAEARSWGTEPGGGLRSIVAGARVVTWGDGSIVASADRLPGTASNVVAVPERMGGGFLFAIGTHLWRSDAWLAPALPVFTSPNAIGSVQVGLDRVYVRTQTGAVAAIDPRQGASMDLGPLPPSPSVGHLAALDAWRAVAVADLRGAMLTLDAGATWRALPLPIQPSDVLSLGDLLAVGGMNAAREVEWWEVRADGQTARLSSAPTTPRAAEGGAAGAPDLAMHVLGPRPLAAAIAEGWPLSDGTALVARDGALIRVSLADGAVAEAVPGAFPLQPSRCQPLALPRDGDPAGFGYLCGEPHGRTLVLRWSPATSRLEELRRFDGPREVLASGLGALAARGPCAPDAAPDVAPPEVAWCLMDRSGAWSEMRFRGEDVDRARLVALHDGHVALVRPPRGGDLSTARLTVTDGTRSTHVPLAFPELRADVGRLLRTGAWLDGFEERRPGVLGGWVEGAGTLVGVEITLDGHVRVGEYVRDAGSPFPAGRFAFGWTASRRGFESTDGGMTWTKDLELPEPIAAPRDVDERACGPVGCLVAGWMRVGWGPTASTATPKEPPPRVRPARDMAPLDLACDLVAPDPPAPAAKGAHDARQGLRPAGPLTLVRPWGMTSLPVTPACVQELARFQGHAPPALGADECGVQVLADQGLEWPLRHMDMAQIYAWGPKSGDWDGTGKWRASWLWPWGGWTDGRSSAVAAAPWGSRELAAHALGVGQSPGAQWVLLPGDDPDHALLVLRHTLGTVGSQVLALDADRPPTDVRRPGGDPFADVEGATRVAGRWYVATAQSAGELPATVVWVLDGASAREIARLPRAGGEALTALRLGRRVDGRAVGVVADGQPSIESGTAPRWVVGIDLESGAVSDPERLAPLVPGDPGASALCSADDGGWEVDLPSPANVRVHARSGWAATLQGTLLRLRLSHDHACIERVSGSLGTEAAGLAAMSSGAARPPDARMVDVSVYASRLRRGLRCVVTH